MASHFKVDDTLKKFNKILIMVSIKYTTPFLYKKHFYKKREAENISNVNCYL